MERGREDVVAWFPLLRSREVEVETLAALAFLSQQGEEGFTKAATLAWIAASKKAIAVPNSWLAKGLREKLTEMGFRWPADLVRPQRHG